MCSRMSWYEPPAVEVAASEDDRVCEDMVWRSMSVARRSACRSRGRNSAFHLIMELMFLVSSAVALVAGYDAVIWKLGRLQCC